MIDSRWRVLPGVGLHVSVRGSRPPVDTPFLVMGSRSVVGGIVLVAASQLAAGPHSSTWDWVRGGLFGILPLSAATVLSHMPNSVPRDRAPSCDYTILALMFPT